MKATRPARWVAAVALAVLPSAAPVEATAAQPSRFVVGTTHGIESLNPFNDDGPTAHEAAFLIYDTLTGWSQADLSPSPTGLAQSWQKSSDGKTWTYYLHQGVRWSDGQPLTARDVVYTFNRLRTGARERAAYEEYVTAITSVTARDDTTVVMQTSEPSPVMERLWVPILPEHVWRGVSEQSLAGFRNEHPVGSGPFSLVDYQPGKLLRFAANRDYFGGPPLVEEVVLRLFTAGEPMAIALRQGEIDLAKDLPPVEFTNLIGTAGITTVTSHGHEVHEIGINTGAATVDGRPIGDGHPALRDARVRQAIARAINRKNLKDTILRGYADEDASLIPALYGGLHWSPGAAVTPFDPAAANELLDRAGYARGSDGIRTMPGSGRRLTFRLYGQPASPIGGQSLRLVASSLRRIGIDPQLTVLSAEQLQTRVGEGRYDLFETAKSVDPDPNATLAGYTCAERSTQDGDGLRVGRSDTFYCNRAYDLRYAQQRTTMDRATREALVRQLQKMLYQDAPCIVTVVPQTLEAYRSDRFTNLKRQPAINGPLVYQFGAYTYRSVIPLDQLRESRRGRPNSALLVGVSVGALGTLIAVFGSIFFRRRVARPRPRR